MRQSITKPNGHLIGYLESYGANQTRAVQPNGNVVGIYDARSNRTTYPNGHLVGNGNFLVSLL